MRDSSRHRLITDLHIILTELRWIFNFFYQPGQTMVLLCISRIIIIYYNIYIPMSLLFGRRFAKNMIVGIDIHINALYVPFIIFFWRKGNPNHLPSLPSNPSKIISYPGAGVIKIILTKHELMVKFLLKQIENWADFSWYFTIIMLF